MKMHASAVLAVLALLVPAAALADEAPAEGADKPASADGKLSYPRVGGHVGVAVPYFEAAKQTSVVGQHKFLTIANPVGVTAKLSGKWAIDFEFIVLNSVLAKSPTQLVIDPGVVYNWGPLNTGLRVAYQVGESGNVGAIPLINKGFSLGDVTWFVEGAFPTFVKDGAVSFNAVLHTGVAF